MSIAWSVKAFILCRHWAWWSSRRDGKYKVLHPQQTPWLVALQPQPSRRPSGGNKFLFTACRCWLLPNAAAVIIVWSLLLSHTIWMLTVHCCSLGLPACIVGNLLSTQRRMMWCDWDHTNAQNGPMRWILIHRLARVNKLFIPQCFKYPINFFFCLFFFYFQCIIQVPF